MHNQIMDVLTPRRMMTVGNLALHFEMDPAALHPWLKELNAAGRIRYAFSKCSGACSTCSTCTTNPDGEAEETERVDPATIVISLELKPTDD